MKTLIYTFAFMAGMGSLQAQHLLRETSLGFSVDFPEAYRVESPEQAEKSVGKFNMQSFSCVTPDSTHFVATVALLPAFPEDEQNIRTVLQEVGWPQNSVKELRVKETFSAGAGELLIDYTECKSGLPGRTRVFYRNGHLVKLQLMSQKEYRISKKDWTRFSTSFKPDW